MGYLCWFVERFRACSCLRTCLWLWLCLCALCNRLCVQDDLPVEDMADDPTMAEVVTACKAADERKAGNIVAIRVSFLVAGVRVTVMG